VYKGTYKGGEVAIKVLRSGAADAIASHSDDGNDSSTSSTSSGSEETELNDERRRRTYEEFRHEVWIMR
jgi:hypothetical protein